MIASNQQTDEDEFQAKHLPNAEIFIYEKKSCQRCIQLR